MTDLQITLTSEERQCLADLLKRALKSEQIEEHRTRTPTYRQNVIHEETLLGNVLKKLGAPSE